MTEATRAPADSYGERTARFGSQRDELARQSRLLSHARVAAFLALAALGVLLERATTAPIAGAVALAAAAFIALVLLHQRTGRRERWFADLASLNGEGLDRIARRWDRLPLRMPTRSIEGHAYAADLDLYGRASVSQILGPVATPFGSATLDDWLLARAEPKTILERQDAVRELAPMHDLRDTLALHGRAARTIRMRDIERFLAWADSRGWALGRSWLWVLAWLLPAATWSLIFAHVLGLIDRSLWLIPLLTTFVMYITVGARARRTFDSAFGREPLFTYYPDMIGALTRTPFSSSLLRANALRLTRAGVPADRQLMRLQRLMHLADLRASSMHLPVFLLTMWDVHVLFAVERWQRGSGAAVRDWLETLGEAEALAALATLAHDQPDWVSPDWHPHRNRRSPPSRSGIR